MADLAALSANGSENMPLSLEKRRLSVENTLWINLLARSGRTRRQRNLGGKKRVRQRFGSGTERPGISVVNTV
jgi:hypothetical protein